MAKIETKNIRNVALLGHGGSGKTSLAEAMLYISGGTDRLGKIADGNTVCDHDSEEIARMTGDADFTVHPRRGEYMLLDKECGKLVSHTIFRCPSKMGKGILVSPTVDGNLLLGPTAENIEDKEDTKTTAEGLAKVRMQAGEQVSGINFGKVITSFTGLRSVGSTGDFVINEKDGFVNCAGIESPGLSSSPAIATYVADILRGAGLELAAKADFNGRRRPAHYYKELTLDEKNEEFTLPLPWTARP